MLLDLIELASNKALEHDTQTLTRLKKLQGKTMTLHIKTLEQSLTLSPQAEGLEFSDKPPESVDVTLKATLGAMIKISRDGMEDANLRAGELEMIGDPIIGQRFAQLIADLDIDWQSLLGEQLGNGPAKAIISAAQRVRDFTQESQSQIKGIASHIMQDELDLVADRAEVDTFLDDVDTLRADTERLFTRLKNLNA